MNDRDTGGVYNVTGPAIILRCNSIGRVTLHRCKHTINREQDQPTDQCSNCCCVCLDPCWGSPDNKLAQMYTKDLLSHKSGTVSYWRHSNTLSPRRCKWLPICSVVIQWIFRRTALHSKIMRFTQSSLTAVRPTPNSCLAHNTPTVFTIHTPSTAYTDEATIESHQRSGTHIDSTSLALGVRPQGAYSAVTRTANKVGRWVTRRKTHTSRVPHALAPKDLNL